MKPNEKSLLKVFRDLSSADQQSVRSFADFLRSKGTKPASDELQAVVLPRPDTESVVAAMKRLSASYPMLEKPALLNETSALMAQHIMQGKEAVVVIDELEVLFLKNYEEFLANKNNKPADEQ